MRPLSGLLLAVLSVLSVVASGCGGPVPTTSTPPRPIVVHRADSVRRVCLQLGLGPDGTGGGSIVFETGNEGRGIGVDTLRGDHVTAPGPDALCAVPEQALRVCPASDGRTGAVDVEDGVVAPKARVATIARGAPLTFVEYVSNSGVTRALVNIDGKARFIAASEVCHPEGIPPRSRATEAFRMNVSVPAGPKAFRPRSTAAIKRIVIHNTESTTESALKHFGRVDANTSAHVIIDRDGSIYRVVEDQFTAFHAGASRDGLGGYNATSLGIEVVAFFDPKVDPGGEAAFFSDAQRAAVIKLVDFWMNEYKLEIAPDILANRSSVEGYWDLEYRNAAVTIHRLTKADRGTDCPRLLFPNSPEGDDAFFRWREDTFAIAARRLRLPPRE